MYDISRKKQRWYRRECRRVLRRVNRITPRYRPDAPFPDETIPLYANLFFKPKGKDRKALTEALLRKTEEIAAGIPADVPFCRVVLAVYEANVASSEIILFFDPHEYDVFWSRNNIQYQKWSRTESPSFARSMGLTTSLTERCYLEEVQNDEDNIRQTIRFYEKGDERNL